MAEAARYFFDRTFEAPVRGSNSRKRTAPRRSQEECDCMMAEARRAAFEEGVAETLKGLEAETRDQVNALLQSAQQLLGKVEHECNAIRNNAITLATTTAIRLAEELTERMPVANLEALFAEALEHIGDTPHITLSVNDALAGNVRKAVSSIADERGFTGKIVVIGDPETKIGDCSLQWADGGIELEQDKIRNAISAIVKRHLEKMDSGAPPPAKSGTDDKCGAISQSEAEIASKAMTGSGEKK